VYPCHKEGGILVASSVALGTREEERGRLLGRGEGLPPPEEESVGRGERLARGGELGALERPLPALDPPCTVVEGALLAGRGRRTAGVPVLGRGAGLGPPPPP